MFSLQARLIGAGVVLLALIAVGAGSYRKGVLAGENAVRAEWQEVRDAQDAEFRRREVELQQQATSLSSDLQTQRVENATLQQDLQHAQARGTLVRTVPGKCPAPVADAQRLWNLAADPASSAISPR